MRFFYPSLLFFVSVSVSISISIYSPTAFAQQGDVQPGVINVRLDSGTTEMVKQHYLKRTDAQNGAESLTGFSVMDAALLSIGVQSMVPVFSAPARFEARHRESGLDRWFTLRIPEQESVHEMAAILSQIAGIERAEPSYIAISHEYTGSIWDEGNMLPSEGQFEPGFEKQWHFENFGTTNGTFGADIDLVPAWTITSGTPNVIVQVIDSGIDTQHPDLEAMLWVNPAPGSTVPGEDIHGWNWVSNNSDIEDHSGHGTHVSGTIAANNDTGTGVAGIAGGSFESDGARIMISRIFEPGSDGSVGAGSNRTAQAIVYGADMGAVISNNSWGYRDEGVFPDIVKAAIDYFIEFAGYDENGLVEGPVAGGVFISSAGNTPDQGAYFPAAYEPVISVAATDHNDQKTSYSNYGISIAVSAPGGQLFAGNFTGGVYSTDLTSSPDPFSYKQGTSMASPHVAGVAALLASHFPGITNEELKARLIGSADNIDSANSSFAGLLGSGRVNAYRALTEDPVPASPDLVFPAHEQQDIETSVLFTWNPVNGAANYHFQLSKTEDFSSVFLDFDGLNETSIERHGFETETSYYWRVRGVGNNGLEGLWSATNSFTTGTVVNISPDGAEIPEHITLAQNYPNPFNPVTQISYALSEPAEISITVYNVAGQRVATLYNGLQQSGEHQVSFDGAVLSSGVYIYQLRTSEMVLNRKMMLVK